MEQLSLAQLDALIEAGDAMAALHKRQVDPCFPDPDTPLCAKCVAWIETEHIWRKAVEATKERGE